MRPDPALRFALADDPELYAAVEAELRSADGVSAGQDAEASDRLKHAAHALRMIAQVQPTEEGARMARGIAEEALSVGLD